MMQLRSMLLSDIAAVAAIEQRAFIAPWPKALLRDCMRVGYDCWVLAEDKGVQGYGIMSIFSGVAHILNLAVAPAQQRKGYGKQLLTHLLAIARQKQAGFIFLEVRVSNIAAIKLYEQFGFNEIDRRQNYYPTGQGHEDALILAMQL